MEILCEIRSAFFLLPVDLIGAALSLIQIVYVCWIAVETVFVYFYIVETKGRTLEETAALFDGEDVAEHLRQQATGVAMHEADTSKRVSYHEDFSEKASGDHSYHAPELNKV